MDLNGPRCATAPDVDRSIEHGLPISFPNKTLTSMVRSVEAPGAAAFTEATDVFGLVCWLFKDQMLAKISAALDEAADDKAALSQQQRKQMIAEIGTSMLAVERAEVACIWHADANGEVIDFRADTTPQAALGIRIVTAASVNNERGSSWQHALGIVGR